MFAFAEKVFNDSKNLTFGNLKSKIKQQFGGEEKKAKIKISFGKSTKFTWVLEDGKSYVFELMLDSGGGKTDNLKVDSLLSCKELVE